LESFGGPTKLGYNGFMVDKSKIIQIGKADFSSTKYDSRHLKGSSWFTPPKLHELKLSQKIFKNKKYKNAKKIYSILIARSSELGGDTKIYNEKLALLTGLSVRQVIRIINFLEKQKLISVLKKVYRSDTGFKTCRVVRVWLSYYRSGCKPAETKVFKNDIRPHKELEEKITMKVPLKYRVWREFVAQKTGTVMKKYDYSILNLTINRFIDQDMAFFLGNMEYIAQSNYMRKMEYNILGYSKEFLVYKNSSKEDQTKLKVKYK
jgi:transcription initiation factor IIE alpha subunit